MKKIRLILLFGFFCHSVTIFGMDVDLDPSSFSVSKDEDGNVEIHFLDKTFYDYL